MIIGGHRARGTSDGHLPPENT